MALRGVWQLQKLIVSYCNWGGSSRGIRAFMELELPVFKEKNPQLEVVTELIRGQHPHLKAFYKNKNERVICVKNMDPEDVLHHATRLRNALGRKVIKLRTRHVTNKPYLSISSHAVCGTIFISFFLVCCLMMKSKVMFIVNSGNGSRYRYRYCSSCYLFSSLSKNKIGLMIKIASER
ncbi:uncharacterized protein LOC107470987 [Arachis duranensis]|uniref:Large ribosomal subunit protein mL43 n=1 Tax=Arachis duranensis TaxID=130453 RepID=A0A6P5MMT8_ARADU|nr:uncharacterized protein LOC107470987 [Arachis duranensis]